MPPLPSGDLQVLVAELLTPGVLRHVHVTQWERIDVRNALTNAEEHLLLLSCLDPDALPEPGKDAATYIRSAAKACRRDAIALLIWRRVPLAKAIADKYRKAIAKNYQAMISAGAVLVTLCDPELAGWYKSRCTE